MIVSIISNIINIININKLIIKRSFYNIINNKNNKIIREIIIYIYIIRIVSTK